MPMLSLTLKPKSFLGRVCVLALTSVLSFSITVLVLFASHVAPAPIVTMPSLPPVAVIPVQPVIRKIPAGIPTRLEISSIGVSTIINHAGLTADGAMDIEDNPDVVAWYKGGPKAGDEGSAVIAGHYGWLNGHPSIFNNLHMLQPGDKVTVYDEKGTGIVFVVRETRKYDPAADASVVFTLSDGKAHLNLITCEGSWNNTEQTYTMRLVVFTDRESQ